MLYSKFMMRNGSDYWPKKLRRRFILRNLSTLVTARSHQSNPKDDMEHSEVVEDGTRLPIRF